MGTKRAKDGKSSTFLRKTIPKEPVFIDASSIDADSIKDGIPNSRRIKRFLPEDPRWPPGLCGLSRMPSALYWQGLAWPQSPFVAIVGTRSADLHALRFTENLAEELSQAGCTVVSGGALGVDRAAHMGAIRGRSASTLVVLATDIENPYPPQNRDLFQQVLGSGGVLCSEVGQPSPPHRGRFLARNRIIAALADAVVVVQAPARSGALSTAAHAEKLNKPLLAVPSAPWDPRGAGNYQLLSRGAHLCARASDVLDLVSAPRGGPQGGLHGGIGQQKNAAHPDELKARRHTAACPLDKCDALTGEQKQLVQSLSPVPISADDLALRLEWPIRRVQQHCMHLVIQGKIQEPVPGSYCIRYSKAHGSTT